MYKIVKKEILCDSVVLMKIDAPFVAKKAEPGQFIILRVSDGGERIPLTISGYDRNEGTVTIIFQSVGATTSLLANKNEGEFIEDFVGPLGKPSECGEIKKVCVVGGGVGNAAMYPISKKVHDMGSEVTAIIGYRDKSGIILENEYKEISSSLYVVTNDGSYGEKGFVTDVLSRLLKSGDDFDKVIAVGPLAMMKAVCDITKEYGINTVVSMNPIMVDGIGMCGACRLNVDGRTVFACVDGPEFDGHKVDFDSVIQRNKMYMDFERRSREKDCNLLKMGDLNDGN